MMPRIITLIWGLIGSSFLMGQSQPTLPSSYDSVIVQHRKLVIEQFPGIETALAPSGVFPRPRRPRSFVFQDFKQGDTLCFSVVATQKPLKEIRLSKEKETILNRVFNQTKFLDTIVVQAEHNFSLHLKGRRSSKQQALDFSVTRIRPVPNDTFYLVTDSIYTVKNSTIHDTVLFTVLDQTLIIPPIWDIEKEPFAQVEVQIPKTAGAGYDLHKVGYWLGIGRECLNNYLALEASVPPAWSKPGAPVALGAFLLGRHPLVLPRTGVTDVVSRFSTAKIGTDQFGRKKSIKTSLPLSILTTDELLSFCKAGQSLATNSPSHNFFACFQNLSSVNSYPIQLKVVGFYQKTAKGPLVRMFKETKTYKLTLEK